jgi:hypothetical protein
MNTWKRLFAFGLFLVPIATTAAQAQEPWRDRGPDRGYDRGYERPYFDTRAWVDRFDRRLNQISARLDQAKMNREVSPREARGLTIQRDRLAGMERAALADRYVTAGERERLDYELRSLAQRLRIEINDRW